MDNKPKTTAAVLATIVAAVGTAMYLTRTPAPSSPDWVRIRPEMLANAPPAERIVDPDHGEALVIPEHATPFLATWIAQAASDAGLALCDRRHSPPRWYATRSK